MEGKEKKSFPIKSPLLWAFSYTILQCFHTKIFPVITKIHNPIILVKIPL